MRTLPQSSKTLSQTGIRLVLSLIALLVGTIVLGKISLVESVKSVDEPLFDFFAGTLQDIPGASSISDRLTRLGSLNVNYGMAVAVGCLVGLQRRRWDIAALVIVSMFGAHMFQELVKEIVRGSIPANDLALGPAGPYFSGGVQRVILIVGIAATLAQDDGGWTDKFVYRLAVTLGVFEAVTRLILGRHWPFDLVAAFPIGITFLWIFRSVLVMLDQSHRPHSISSEHSVSGDQIA